MSDKFTLEKFDAFCEKLNNNTVQPYYVVLPKPLVDAGVTHGIITKDGERLNCYGATVVTEKE
jgi:hypothetical protein